MQPEGSPLQARKSYTRNQIWGTLILDFQPPEFWGINTCCLNHPVCTVLLQQPEPTNTGFPYGEGLQVSHLLHKQLEASLIGWLTEGRESDEPGYKSFCHCLAVWTWASLFTSLNFNFLICPTVVKAAYFPHWDAVRIKLRECICTQLDQIILLLKSLFGWGHVT